MNIAHTPASAHGTARPQSTRRGRKSPWDGGETIPGSQQSAWFWVCFTIAWASTGVAQGVSGVAIPQLLRAWDADTATGSLSLILAAGGFATMLTTPIFGHLSDRSRSRFGLRRPWILYGSVTALIGYGVLAASTTPVLLAVGVVINVTGWGAVAMAQHSLFADQIRTRIRALMSAVTGAAATIGILAGVWAAGSLAPLGQVALFLMPGGVAVILSMTLFFTLRDLHRTRPTPPLQWRDVWTAFWINPRTAPDFAWAWACRFFMTAAVVSVTNYLYLTIAGRFDVEDPAQIASIQAQATLVFAVTSLLTAFIAGAISDRTGRRKPTVVAGALLSAVGIITAIAYPDLSWFIVGIAIVGAGQGAYIAADVALMTECLPRLDEAGKGLGIVALAYLLPNIFVPVLGFFLTRIESPTGENFVALYAAAIVMSLIAAISVLRVKIVT